MNEREATFIDALHCGCHRIEKAERAAKYTNLRNAGTSRYGAIEAIGLTRESSLHYERLMQQINARIAREVTS